MMPAEFAFVVDEVGDPDMPPEAHELARVARSRLERRRTSGENHQRQHDAREPERELPDDEAPDPCAGECERDRSRLPGRTRRELDRRDRTELIARSRRDSGITVSPRRMSTSAITRSTLVRLRLAEEVAANGAPTKNTA